MDFEPIALLGRWMLSSFTWPAALDSAGMRDARQGLNNAGDIWNCWRGGLEIKLVDLLTITYGFETRHPADRILALLGLWRRNDYNARRWLRAGESWGGVAPENAQHSIRTYANGIREAVTEGSSGLEILCMVELGKKRAHSADKLMIYPSWLPTLGAQPSVHALKIRRKWANASGNTWPVVHLDTPWNVLGVDGFLISEIVCSFDLADADSSGSDGEVHCSSIPMERESFRTVKLDVFADILTDRPQGRCVWKTSSRQGYAKSGVRAGDMLCILFGCWAPVILRQDGEGWIFVALALAEDLMDVSRFCALYEPWIDSELIWTGSRRAAAHCAATARAQNCDVHDTLKRNARFLPLGGMQYAVLVVIALRRWNGRTASYCIEHVSRSARTSALFRILEKSAGDCHYRSGRGALPLCSVL